MSKGFSEEEVAQFLNIKAKTLKTYRSAKKGMGKEFLKFHPPFFKYGRTIYFDKEQFHQWFREKQVSCENKRIDEQLEAIDQFKARRRNAKSIKKF